MKKLLLLLAAACCIASCAEIRTTYIGKAYPTTGMIDEETLLAMLEGGVSSEKLVVTPEAEEEEKAAAEGAVSTQDASDTPANPEEKRVAGTEVGKKDDEGPQQGALF